MNKTTNFQFSELTSAQLETMLTTLDAVHALDALMEERHVVPGGEDIELADLGDAIIEEMTRRAMEDAGYKVNELVARGELDRYVRPDGQIGYAPSGAYDEAQS